MRVLDVLREAAGPAVPGGPVDRATRAISWVRVVLGTTAVILESVFHTMSGTTRIRFFVLVGLVFVPYAISTVLLRARRSVALRISMPFVDLLMLFSFQAFLPPPNAIPLLANVLVVTYATALRGIAAGILTTALASGFAFLALAINPVEAIDVFFKVIYPGLLASTAFLVHAATHEQRMRGSRQTQLHLSSISHELRTPLTAIGGFAETLRDQGEALDDATRAMMLQRIADNTQELDQLIGPVLEFAGLEVVKSTPEPSVLPLAREVTRFIDTHRPALGAHPISVGIDAGLKVRAEPFSLQRVLANLLTNASKYSPAGAPIEVVAHEGTKNQIVVSVRDHGPGIPTEDQPHIFDPFYRGRRTNQPGGTGLGLALVRMYVERNAGRVWVDSRPDAGSAFSFTLPAARQPQQEPRP